ncbi:unnamed protein product [Pleuronectes platessa]|uniref:Uncharacterized protein n=2 Tax=Pleuronectes platessa TaxID=8262 RepID=A0A9N7TRN9_PLEPL|nr:unnamed protein product [Pleuronectes platessa]
MELSDDPRSRGQDEAPPALSPCASQMTSSRAVQQQGYSASIFLQRRDKLEQPVYPVRCVAGCEPRRGISFIPWKPIHSACLLCISLGARELLLDKCATELCIFNEN